MSQPDPDIVATALEPGASGPGTAGPGRASVATEPREGLLFCPRRGLNAGATQRLASQTASLLQSRLAAVAVIALVGSALATARFAVYDPNGVPVTLFNVVLAGSVLLSLRRWRLQEGGLRILEAFLLGAMVLSTAINQVMLLGVDIRSGNLLNYTLQANRMPGIYVLFMALYAILIPARWTQTLGYVLAVSAVGVAAQAAPFYVYPQLRQFPEINMAEQVSFLLFMMVLGGFLAVFGTWVISGYRKVAAEAGDAGMYRLLGKLGEGGMGEVWRAEHRMLARPAAIKIIRPEMLGGKVDPGMVTARFTREARATATLRSPNTVQLYDFGVTEGGTFFYVMEFLRGLDLEQLVERFGLLPPARATHLLTQAARSLGEAHSRGLVHRDIKPANLHVGALADEYDWLKVLDFGLVKSFDEADGAATNLTVEGVATGTPAYFPPEMARGASAADERSDVYALAAVGYWLLTGTLVFEGVTAMEMVLKHVQEEPVPPSKRSDVAIAPSLDQAILAGLQKAPGDRPQSMTEFAQLLAEADTGARWTQRNAVEWWQLHLPELAESQVA